MISERCIQRNHYFDKYETASKAPQNASKTFADASNGFAKHFNRVLRRSRTASGRPNIASNTLLGRNLRGYWTQTWRLIYVYCDLFVFYELEDACKTVQDGSRSPQDTTRTPLRRPQDAPRRFQNTSASFQDTATDCSVSTYRELFILE